MNVRCIDPVSFIRILPFDTSLRVNGEMDGIEGLVGLGFGFVVGIGGGRGGGSGSVLLNSPSVDCLLY